MVVEDKGTVKKDNIDTTKMLSAACNSYCLIKFHIIKYNKVFFSFRIDCRCSQLNSLIDAKTDKSEFDTVQVFESSVRVYLVNYACEERSHSQTLPKQYQQLSISPSDCFIVIKKFQNQILGHS